MPKKIAIVNGFCSGSTGNIIKDIAAHDKNHENDYYFFGTGPIDETNILKGAYVSSNKFSYYLNRIQTYIFGNDGFIFGYNNFKILKNLRRIKPDIIHLHNVHNSFSNLSVILKYAYKNKVKVVWTLHDTWLLTGRCGVFCDCMKWKKGCGNCKKKKIYPKSLIDLSSLFHKRKRALIEKYKNIINFVSPSKWLANLMETNLNLKVNVINNGVDQSIFKRTSSSEFITKFSNGRIVIGGAAFDFNSLKGIDDFNNLNSLINKEKFCVVLIGLKISQPVIKDDILFLPRTKNRKEMAQFYSSINWFFNPTKIDNYPTTHLESLSCGVPVITYDVGGASEAIDDVSGGFSVKYGDVNSVLNIIENKNIKVDIKKIEKFSKIIFAEKYLDLYNKI